MANYLVAKCGNTTSSYSLRNTEPSKPYLKVSNSYLPLTTNTKTGLQVKINANTYAIQESYSTTVSSTYLSTETSSTTEYDYTDTFTSYLQKIKTFSSYALQESTMNVAYSKMITRSSTIYSIDMFCINSISSSIYLSYPIKSSNKLVSCYSDIKYTSDYSLYTFSHFFTSAGFSITSAKYSSDSTHNTTISNFNNSTKLIMTTRTNTLSGAMRTLLLYDHMYITNSYKSYNYVVYGVQNVGSSRERISTTLLDMPHIYRVIDSSYITTSKNIIYNFNSLFFTYSINIATFGSLIQNTITNYYTKTKTITTTSQ